MNCGLNIFSLTRSVVKKQYSIKCILRAQSGSNFHWKYKTGRPFSDDASNTNLSNEDAKKLKIGGKQYDRDGWSNVTPKIISLMNRQLHNQKHHPLQLIKERIANYMYQRYPGPFSPLFSLHDKVI